MSNSGGQEFDEVMAPFPKIVNPVAKVVYVGRSNPGLTLIELIIVLALLGIVLSIGAPSLAKFFRGRDLQNEVNRFVSATRYAHQRAVSEGIPIVVWIDMENRTYRINADPTFVPNDPLYREFTLPKDISLNVEYSSISGTGQVGVGRLSGFTTEAGEATIRFMPNGFITVESPVRVTFVDRYGFSNSLVQNRFRTWYEIEAKISQYSLR